MLCEPTVFVVDDDQAVRSALHFTVKSAGLNVKLHSSAQEFLKTYDSDRPGCLILDVRMPGMSGLDLQKELKAHDICLPVIFLTGHGDVAMAVRALKQGAFEFLEKPFDNGLLLACIQRAIAADAQAQRQAIQRRKLANRLAQLTLGEQKVLDKVIEGRSNKAIAAELGMSISTIETRRRHIMQKLHAQTLTDLVQMVVYLRSHKGFPQNYAGIY